MLSKPHEKLEIEDDPNQENYREVEEDRDVDRAPTNYL